MSGRIGRACALQERLAVVDSTDACESRGIIHSQKSYPVDSTDAPWWTLLTRLELYSGLY
jgi:hypothetical protein